MAVQVKGNPDLGMTKAPAGYFRMNAAMALEGVGKMTSMETEDEVEALRALAFELCSATAKVQKQWEELFELSKRERA